jgi:hypothetical protein
MWPPRQQWNAITVFEFEALWLKGLPQQTGNYAAGSRFPLLRDLLDGKQDLIVDVQGGSHPSSIEHQMRDAHPRKVGTGFSLYG